MSAWKPKKKQKGGRRNRGGGRHCRTPPFEVWDAGPQIGLRFADGPQGWLPGETYDRHRKPGQQAQMSRCRKTGEIWVKPIVGRHRHRDEAELRERLGLLAEMAEQLGGVPPVFGGDELWMQVEFLENLLEFELRPPCGCPPPSSLAQA